LETQIEKKVGCAISARMWYKLALCIRITIGCVWGCGEPLRPKPCFKKSLGTFRKKSILMVKYGIEVKQSE